ncbi:tetratricopeptide repeat protein [Geofilum sp. OHC36d9]|uniref:tetratricopeptide repeat protein n=1 Tax=Geofilum sp. OHC36d9 TaxID=3458413 RepID=UPI004033C315
MKTNYFCFALALMGSAIFSTTNAQQADSTASLSTDTVATESTPSFEDQELIRLFNSHIKKGNYQWALILWDEIKTKDTPELQYAYLEALEATGKKDSMYIKHQEFLKKYPDYAPALFWQAKYHFNKAEKLYQSEMSKYNKNKNATTYAYLRRELKRISVDYKRAKDILEKLTEKDPTNKNQLVYLRNCYVRLEMQEEAVKINKIIDSL